MRPDSTISTTFASPASLMRMPSMVSPGRPPSCRSVRAISGPLPCTTIGNRPADCSRFTSPAKLAFSASFTSVAPPTLMTARVPVKRAMYESASTSSARLKPGV